MKKAFVIFLLLNGYYSLLSQHFSTKLYLQGTTGKDTIEIGYDESATSGVDIAFGEVNFTNHNLNNKFGSFIVDPSIINPKIFLLKKQILGLYSGMVENGAMGIVVPFDSLPVSVSWDKSLFVNLERNYSLITDWTMGGWFDAGIYTFKTYLNEVSTINIPKTKSNYIYNDGIKDYSMYIFYLAFAKEENIFSDNINILENSTVKIYPNPATNFFNVYSKSSESIKRIKIFTFDGRLIENLEGSCSAINCSTWRKGLYMVMIELNSKTIFYKIQIKM